MNTKCEGYIKKLIDMSSYFQFEDKMLPNNISVESLKNGFNFLSPEVLLLHGSNVSGKKFSNKKTSDLDVICVSHKAAFFPLKQLYEKLESNFQKEKIKIDASIISCNELSSLIKCKTSLGVSLSHGFSIIYYEGIK